MKELQYLNKYFLKYKYRFLLGIIITIVAQIFSLFTPELVGNSIKTIEIFIKSNGQNSDYLKSNLLKNIGLIILCTLIAGFLTFLMRQTLIVMSRFVEFDLKNEIFLHYEALSQNFYKKNRTGDLMNRISEDVGKVRMYVGPAVMYTINTIIRFAAIIISMSSINWKLTLYSLAPLPILSYSIFILSKEINKKSTNYQQNLSKLSSFTQEFFSGIRVIKAYALEQKRNEEFKTLSNDSKTKNLALSKTNALFGPLMVFLIGLSYLIVILVGGKMYINEEIKDLGVIAQFLLYIGMLVWPVASFGWVSSLVQEAEASQKRINEFLKEKPEIKNEGSITSSIKGQIEFKNVSYTYEDTNIQALKNINFKIDSGKTLAILGKTGSGKSTILNLITRIHDIESGEITIDNNTIKSIELVHLRNNISIVPQDPFLFSDTIKNNILFGKSNALDEEIIEVAKIASVHENIANFTNKYETMLGERGITLSGGQKQRISIARAILKQAPILLLDDCLSAVDTETEEKILSNFKNIFKNKTTIIVTHRASSAKNADQIIILDEGNIIQQGTHNELINKEGYYKELFLKQLSEKEIA
ncbi:Probable ABC-type multidrug transport system, ATPase and permease components [Flavobacterium indicum GPTSA100-9 = DSM 17447]|uniref:Probable ABC-type multidrug transport system, ATPase and permease components n=1 Tax=Flavobacterium indicum (strain DSM 17447 / CIP 109464 / GPTSA100-9) TaxID=1094466 RepID=H8XTG3_FLAIG|nr:ABC transporter ATP-binding protein [Flavobacterium indicum]CCG52760.1 Probable ABC-type multidrug transport system, ATPase and permease components [Flavobacterium indicum GPTSA100-9 = DSM 17447]